MLYIFHTMFAMLAFQSYTVRTRAPRSSLKRDLVERELKDVSFLLPDFALKDFDVLVLSVWK